MYCTVFTSVKSAVFKYLMKKHKMYYSIYVIICKKSKVAITT